MQTDFVICEANFFCDLDVNKTLNGFCFLINSCFLGPTKEDSKGNSRRRGGGVTACHGIVIITGGGY